MSERFYIPTAGTTGRPRNLEACLRDVYEAQRESLLARNRHREDYGIPLDSDTDFEALLDALKDAEAGAQKADGPAAVAALRKASALLEAPVEDPGEYPGQPQYAPISVRLRAVSSATYRAAVSAVRRAKDAHPDDEVAAWGAVVEAQRDFVAQAVAEVTGLEGDDGPIEVRAVGARLAEDALDILEAGRLLDPLFVAARAFQELEGNARRRFGASPPPTSRSSTATSAPGRAGHSSDAREGRSETLTFPGPGTSPASALDASSSATRGSPKSESSTARPTEERSASLG